MMLFREIGLFAVGIARLEVRRQSVLDSLSSHFERASKVCDEFCRQAWENSKKFLERSASEEKGGFSG